MNELVPYPDLKSEWGPEDSGLLMLTYVAKSAGNSDLVLWVTDSNGAREQLPGSPFALHVTAGPATPAASYVDGYQVEAKRSSDKSSAANKAKGMKPSSIEQTASDVTTVCLDRIAQRESRVILS